MPEIDPELMTHKLAVHPASRPVQQRRQKLGLERAQVVEEQVQALLEARFIREVKYPAWLENVILVKKQNGNWRMCVDYTDLNKACPKDPYPLPNIDTLVDSSSGGHISKVNEQGVHTSSWKPNGKLSKFDLKYETRTAIKAQCLTDFVAEYTGDQIETSTTWELYVGGSSNKVGSGAGIILVNEEGTQIEVSLKFDFSTSNNQAEYEALIAGLKLAKEIGATKETEVKHKARKLNSRADALSKLASTKPRRNNRSLIQEILQDPSVIKMNSKSDVLLVSGLNLGWMIPIVEYLKFDILPEEQKEAYKCRKEAQNYTLVRNVLYKRGISIALLKCVPTSKTEDVLDEVHNGICGNHLRARSLARKVIRAGFFWPTLQKNATNSVKKCQHCQMHANFHVAPPEELISVTSPRPFAKWGLYLLRPFFQAPG
ncbi:uncharacterized protein [Arachis hypogaea]|uniref:uncharacterized protein n=1 Tax=Arachis hypogaea TaxID=3818 RepID=UPI003B212D35